MEQEIACPGSNGNVTLRAESFPYSQIPGQSKLFLQYQKDPLSLRTYYPSAVNSHTEISDRIPDVLANYTTDRELLCDTLAEINKTYNASEKVFENIALLRKPNTVAVLTGQQAGLFTGPLYTLYKALSAIRAAECLRGRGFDAVPVFWIATEDHDFDEVNQAFGLDQNSHLVEFKTEIEHHENAPVGSLLVDNSIDNTIAQLIASLKVTEFSGELEKIIRKTIVRGDSFGTVFGKLISALTAEYGLILIDPLHSRIKELASPIYAEAVRRSSEIVDALIKRSRELKSSGYEAQVEVGEDYFPLFWHSDDGRRLQVRSTGRDTLKVKGLQRELTKDELLTAAENEPWRLSPSVVLRPVVQDHLFPTICYFGGGAEIAYFAQNSEVYRCLERPVTPILHRQSFTVVEGKHKRTMGKYDIGFADIFEGLDKLLPRVADRFLNENAAHVFDEVRKDIEAQLDRLEQSLNEVDITLAANLETRRKKIRHHLDTLQRKQQIAEVHKDDTLHRRLTSMLESLYPRHALQERTLNITYFLNQYGPRFIDWMYRSTDLDDRSHRVIYL